MINFRYHVVSLTAVFLALAIGLVVGTAALNGPVADGLQKNIAALNKDNSNKRDQIDQYRDELSKNQDFATQIAPTLLAGKLAGRKVVVLSLPNTKNYADQVAAMFGTAGATITARITMNDKFFDPANAFELVDLAGKLSQPSIPIEGLPLNNDGVETASAQLALALVARAGAGATPAAPDDVTAVLTAYTEQGYLTAADKATGGADAVVMVSGAPATDQEEAKKSKAAVTLAAQFIGKDRRPMVIAGDGVGEGNLISAVRGDPTLAKDISTVDNASSPFGQVATGMAAYERFVQNRTGQYGLGAGAASLVPKSAS